ncbi:hypothetical protein OsJ_14230 [Oryza sativa Japonica Group]|uniref:Uncharacterized protein n=1 Tax=Oryza sativa subsp. japonica TaxID=39947 RepID=B9FED7_ORYSJ|nr:hypothetical protein OsJ_14230 [Oryza sativa Japonica Group]
MSVLGGCRILQDTPSPFHVHRGQGSWEKEQEDILHTVK